MLDRDGQRSTLFYHLEKRNQYHTHAIIILRLWGVRREGVGGLRGCVAANENLNYLNGKWCAIARTGCEFIRKCKIIYIGFHVARINITKHGLRIRKHCVIKLV